MTTYAYLRVSTDDQDNGVDAQRTTISKSEHVDEWVEERASGKDLSGRPLLQDLLDRVCDEQATLVVSKLDRLGRSVIDVLQIFEKVKECGASIKVLDMGIDTSTPAGQMMLTVLAAFAQFERQMISQRTKDGLAAARDKGVQLGRPRTFDEAKIREWSDHGATPAMIARQLGCSIRTVQRVLRDG